MLPPAQDESSGKPEQVLAVIDCIRQMGQSVIGLDGTDGQVMADRDIEAATYKYCKSVRRRGFGRRCGWEGRIESMDCTEQSLSEQAVTRRPLPPVRKSGSTGKKEERERLVWC